MTEALTCFLRINRDAPVPLVTQLAQQLTWLIVRGQVPPGEQLPPVREFARELDINLKMFASAKSPRMTRSVSFSTRRFMRHGSP